jgi:hypothetical protein
VSDADVPVTTYLPVDSPFGSGLAPMAIGLQSGADGRSQVLLTSKEDGKDLVYPFEPEPMSPRTCSRREAATLVDDKRCWRVRGRRVRQLVCDQRFRQHISTRRCIPAHQAVGALYAGDTTFQ